VENKMKKRIIIGSVLVLILFLLMPSIPAIQHKTIEDDYAYNLKEKLKSINIDDLKGLLNEVKYPLLKNIVKSIQFCLNIRVVLWVVFITRLYMESEGFNTIFLEIVFVLSMTRCLHCIAFAEGWNSFWNKMSDKYGWNWDLLEYE
jgi:hypothetical protein